MQASFSTTVLPGWRDGPARTAILDFVARVTDPDDSGYVPPADRIATFDNDGTLWCEYPNLVQAYFLLDRIRSSETPPAAGEELRELFLHGTGPLRALDKREILQRIAELHGGMTEEAFASITAEWFRTARHPTLGRLFRENLYQPQLELLELLRANGFRVFIVSGGGIDFIRAVSEEAYGINRENVVGSSNRQLFELDESGAHIRKLPELACFDDREAKPANIALHIGRRPILAFGNSDGDLPMLRYVLAGEGLRLALLLHHDDAEREFAYDRDFMMSPLNEGLQQMNAFGLTLVSMRRDWATVFKEAQAGR